MAFILKYQYKAGSIVGELEEVVQPYSFKTSFSNPIPIYVSNKINNGNEEKGREFEYFVLDRFNQRFFTLLEWQGDKSHNGRYALSNMNPDMVFRFKSSMHCIHFAVECKWRKDTTNGLIEWARDYQLDNYKNFANQRRMPVFIILGIGGSPANPESVFIMPINEIYSNILSEEQLGKYYRFRKSNFYLQPESIILV
jgi:hypothetical protein